MAAEALVLTFLAEWGDRSQIATISLAAHMDPYMVTLGAILGHCVTTGLAVVGGELLAKRISQRTVAVAGGCLFFVFALLTLFQRDESGLGVASEVARRLRSSA